MRQTFRSTLHFPVLIPGTSLPLHSATEVLSYTLGYALYRRLKRSTGDTYDSHGRLTMLVVAAAGALLGARLAGGFENPALLSQHGWEVKYWMENKSVLGGLVGGYLVVEVYKLLIGERRSSGDLYVFPMIAALMIGRIGCFTMGIAENCFGTVTDSPLGMDLGDGLPRHPLMLYELAFLPILALVLWRLQKRWGFGSGKLFRTFTGAYFAFRFVVEFWKPDPDILGPLSTLQLFALAGLGIVAWRSISEQRIVKSEQ